MLPQKFVIFQRKAENAVAKISMFFIFFFNIKNGGQKQKTVPVKCTNKDKPNVFLENGR